MLNNNRMLECYCSDVLPNYTVQKYESDIYCRDKEVEGPIYNRLIGQQSAKCFKNFRYNKNKASCRRHPLKCINTPLIIIVL